MAAPKLYEEGWKQGSLIHAPLDVHYLDEHEGVVVDKVARFELWLLATQDCDLSQTSSTNTTRQFELRPLFDRGRDETLDGIRTRSVAVSDTLVLRADSPKLMLTARSLNTFKDRRDDELSTERRVQIKTWLGLRYDRAAIPVRFESLGQLLKKLFVLERPVRFEEVIRDVLVYFETEREVRLIVIVSDRHEGRIYEVTDWIDDVASGLFDSSDVVTLERTAATSRGISLWMIQNYFGLDSTGLSLAEIE
jgi:hypothetical protein